MHSTPDVLHCFLPIPDMTSAVIVTPSIGSRHLQQALLSVQAQTYTRLEHWVISDGPLAAAAVEPTLAAMANTVIPIHHVRLPHNTGGGGMNGYRIIAAAAHLVEADVVLFLDDDNWYEPTHVEHCMATLSRYDCEWAFALRTIMREKGSALIPDDCDSLGPWRRAASFRGDAELLDSVFQRFYATHPFLVDTNCYAIRRDVLTTHVNAMRHPYWGDSMLANVLIENTHGATTGERTVYYRARESRESHTFDYFQKGNQEHQTRFGGLRPWTRRQNFRPLREIETPK